MDAEPAQSAADERRFVPVVMIAQDREGGYPPAQPPQEWYDPAPVIITVDKVAGKRHQVWLPNPAFVHDFLVELAIGRAGEVEIAQVKDCQSIPSRRQIGHLQGALGEIDLKDFIPGQSSQMAISATSNRLVP
jgi:hypothetical protein